MRILYQIEGNIHTYNWIYDNSSASLSKGDLES